VKDPIKLQNKLVRLLSGTPALHVMPNSSRPWDDLELREVAWIVQDFVNQNREVIECDPLKDWIEEYKFFRADSRAD